MNRAFVGASTIAGQYLVGAVRAQAMATIASGKHALCETFLAASIADAQTMVLAAERSCLAFAANHPLRSAGTGRRQTVNFGETR